MRVSKISLVLLLAATIPAQTHSVSLVPVDVNSYAAGQTAPPTTLTNIVRTELLTVTLSSSPTIPMPPPAQLVPRAVALYIGLDDPTPTMFPEGLVYIDLFATTPPPTPLFDSFTDPFAPTYGPPLQGPTNTLTLTLKANLFDPLFPLPSPAQTLTIQAVCQDTPGGVGLILSNPARFQLVDPEAEGLLPVITGISPTEGPEAGGTLVTISGDNFLAQSDWATFPPMILFGTQPVTQITVVDRNTIMVVAPPTAFPTNPPMTAACYVDVTFVNNTTIVPTAAAITSPTQFLYKTGQTPVITGFDTATGSPEGGYARQIQGSWFLDGLTVTFTSQADPSLTTTLTAPVATPGAGGTTVNITSMPPFCTGPVDVVVNNCDDESSNSFVFTYDVLQPTLASGSPTVTAVPELGGQTFIAINETGTNLTLTGTNYLPATSPLATASTVIPGSFYPTRTFTDAFLEPGLAATSGTSISGVTAAFAATTMFRPELGFHELRIENPPCVNAGTSSPISNPPCPPLTPPCTIVVQDALPPTVNDIFPGIGVTTGNTFVEIRGSNFFSLQPGVTVQDFTPFMSPGGGIASIDATQITVPAVQFGARFSELVEILDEQTLRVKLPPATVAATSSSVMVTVHNPDLQRTTSAVAFKYVPPLTDPTNLLDPMVPKLDASTLEMIAAGDPTTQTPGVVPLPGAGLVAAPAITMMVNPSPQRDELQDPKSPPAGETWSYDYVFLLNTRLDGPSPAGTRRFEFDCIELPETIELVNGGFAFVPPIEPTAPALFAPGSIVPIPASFDPGNPGVTRKIRVIVKAFGYSLSPTNRIQFDPADNPPLVLMSHNDLIVDGLIDCAGDAFMIEGFVNLQGSAVSGPFRVRVDRTIPPAGAGQGGRGGAWFPEGVLQLPGPNFGVGPGILAGMAGFPAPGRFDQAGVMTSVRTEGTGGLGAAPIGVQSGAGGGAGHTGVGNGGATGTSPGGLGGLSIGSLTNALPMPALGTPNDDRYIFGTNGVDFTRFADGSALTSGLLYGGSGGAGGGGGLAIFVPALTLGGRGGNGGGCVVLISDRLLTIADGGAVFAQGEQGQLGVDAFPVYNGDPVIPVNLPGAGGSGSGGTVLGLAIADVCFAYGPPSVCGVGQSGLVAPMGFLQVDVSGAPPGPQTAPEGLMNPGVPAGGFSSEGRVRFAISAQSPYVAEFTSILDTLFDPMTPVIGPLPPGASTTPGSLYPGTYYTFPQN